MENGFFNQNQDEKKSKPQEYRSKYAPSRAYEGMTWLSLLVGVTAYLIGLYNAGMQLNEKGYYFAVLMFALYASVSLQKAVRDKLEGIEITAIYYGISWFAMLVSVCLLIVGLYNAGSLALSEKGFYAMSFTLSLFSAVSVQKNIRDAKRVD